MTAPQLTATGYQGQSYEDRRLAVVTTLRASDPDLVNTSFDADTADGQVINVHCEQTTQLDESLEAAYNAMNPDAATPATSLVIAKLRGTRPRAATKGLVTVTVNLTSAQSISPGNLIIYPTASPTTRWVNYAAAVSTTAGNYSVVFEAEFSGRVLAPAASLVNFIPITGVVSVTNPADAVPGRDQDTPAITLFRSEALQYRSMVGNELAIRAELIATPGVIDAYVTRDDNLHTLHAYVWDESGPNLATNQDIANAIYLKAPPGITQLGAVSVTSGFPITIKFDRATEIPVYATAVVTSPGNIADLTAVKAAIVAAMPTVMKGKVFYSNLFAAALKVTGVTDLVLTIGTSPSPVGTSNITTAANEIATLDTAHVTVSYA